MAMPGKMPMIVRFSFSSFVCKAEANVCNWFIIQHMVDTPKQRIIIMKNLMSICTIRHENYFFPLGGEPGTLPTGSTSRLVQVLVQRTSTQYDIT